MVNPVSEIQLPVRRGVIYPACSSPVAPLATPLEASRVNYGSEIDRRRYSSCFAIQRQRRHTFNSSLPTSRVLILIIDWWRPGLLQVHMEIASPFLSGDLGLLELYR